MATWEYKIVERSTMKPKLTKIKDVEKYPNGLGQQGWELVLATPSIYNTITYSLYYLKRQRA